MKLNNITIRISPCITEMIDNQTILYSKEEKRVIVVNETAAIIWREIVNANAENKDLTTEQIAQAICDQYFLDENVFAEICDDVTKTIDIFWGASLLIHYQE